MKKGVIDQMFLYVAGGVIAALAIYFGVGAVLDFRQSGEESNLILLKNTISQDVERISSLYGSNRTFYYNLGSDFTQICFSDNTKNEQITKDLKLFDNSVEPNPLSPYIINDSAASDSKNNVFLLGPKTEAFNAGQIRICTKNVTCFDAVQGRVKVEMYGGGAFALMEPCEIPKITPPDCNPGSDLVKEVEVPQSSQGPSQPILPPENEMIMMNASGLGGMDTFEFSWVVVRPDGDIVEEDGDLYKVPTQSSDIQSTVQYDDIDVTGVYTFIGVATSQNTGKQCSLRFRRVYQSPGDHYPTAEIYWPLAGKLERGVPYVFNGTANDKEPGSLNYSWDLVKSTRPETSTAPSARTEEWQPINVSSAPSIIYVDDRLSLLIKFTVTNSKGLSAVDLRRYYIGNIGPWITVIEPENNAVRFADTGDDFADVNFSFIPSGPEETSLDCWITLRNQSGNELRFEHDDLFNDTLNKFTHHIPLGYYMWTVSCSDGIDVNTSSVRILNVTPLLNVAPVIDIKFPTADGDIIPNPAKLTFNVTDPNPEDTTFNCVSQLFNSSNIKLGNDLTNNSVNKGVDIFNTYPNSLAQGQYYWRVTCADSKNLFSTEERIFNITQAPFLTCVVKPLAQGCGTLTPIFSISDTTNAHASIFTIAPNSYNQLVCCNLSVGTLAVTECGLGETPFITLSSESNAHVGDLNAYVVSPPNKKLCMKEQSGTYSISCSVQDALCPQDCVVTMSSLTNAHAASCDGPAPYGKHVCCSVS